MSFELVPKNRVGEKYRGSGDNTAGRSRREGNETTGELVNRERER
jgi:hypothetical protein